MHKKVIDSLTVACEFLSRRHWKLLNYQIIKLIKQNIFEFIEPYRVINDREPMTIKGFELSRSIKIPKFNRENALNDTLEQCANIKFSNHRY
jgi:hypothetical protein